MNTSLDFIADFREIRSGVEEQQGGRPADALRPMADVVSLRPFTAEGEAEVAGAPEIPELGGDRSDSLLLLVHFLNNDGGVHVLQRFSRLIAGARRCSAAHTARSSCGRIFRVQQVGGVAVCVPCGACRR